jgi:hypothetical protein
MIVIDRTTGHMRVANPATVQLEPTEDIHEPGPETMSLRDRFAMHALSGMMTFWRETNMDEKEMAEQAYKVADHMLMARRTV